MSCNQIGKPALLVAPATVAAAVVARPTRFTVSGPVTALLVNVIESLSAPAAVGWNCSETKQPSPGWMNLSPDSGSVTHVEPVMANDEPSARANGSSTSADEPPAFETNTLTVWLRVPTWRSMKRTGLSDDEMAAKPAGAMPRPLSATPVGLFLPLWCSVRLAVMLPVVVGAKCTSTEHESVGCRTAPEVQVLPGWMAN